MTDIQEQLIVRDGMTIRECGSLEDALLWCYRHDTHAVVPWPEGYDDPDFDLKVRFALPHLEDYLRLILKAADAIDVPALARSLYPTIVAGNQAIERDAGGLLTIEGVGNAQARFRTPAFHRERMDREDSIYPFPTLEIDIAALRTRKVSVLGDPDVETLAQSFEEHFPSVCALAKTVVYPSYKDPTYVLHVDSIGWPMQSFLFSNPIVPDVIDAHLQSKLGALERYATLRVRPRSKDDVEFSSQFQEVS